MRKEFKLEDIVKAIANNIRDQLKEKENKYFSSRDIKNALFDFSEKIYAYYNKRGNSDKIMFLIKKCLEGDYPRKPDNKIFLERLTILISDILELLK